MASIAIVTDPSTTSQALAPNIAILSEMGHTTTRINSDVATVQNLTAHAMILALRPTAGNAAHNNVIHDAVSAGTPLLMGPSSGSFGSLQLATTCGLVGSISGDAIQDFLLVPATMGADKIVQLSRIAPGSQYNPWEANDGSQVRATWTGRISSNVPKAPEAKIVSVMPSDTGTSTLIYAEKGTIDLFSQTFGAMVAFIGFLWPEEATAMRLSASGKAMFQAFVSEALGSTRYIRGTVVSENDEPLDRSIRVYRRDNMSFIGGTTSSSVDGKYSIVVPTGDECLVLCLDQMGGTRNSLVADHVVGIKEVE